MPEHLRLVRRLDRPIAEPRWPPGVTLVPFAAANAPAVHALMRAAYAAGGGRVPDAVDGWWAATRHDPEFDAGLCFVAEADGAPVGFALCWRSAFVKDLVVHPEWQGKGIGSALLLTALRELAGRGRAEAVLKVHADNMRARRLYAEVGFHKD